MRITRVAEKYRNWGYSLGLQYPLIWGKTPFGWAVWNRHTGEIVFHPKERRESTAERLCQKHCEEQPGYGSDKFSPYFYDSVS